MKNAFTMIELIFVIVILGILAAVAIPRLASSRNDAIASRVANDLGNCITNAGGAYQMDNAFDIASAACVDVIVTEACFTLTPDNTTGTLVVADAPGAAVGSVCAAAQALVATNTLSAPAPGVSHRF